MNQQTGPSNQQAGPSNQPPVVLPNTYYNPYVSFGTLPSQQMYGPGNYGPPGPYIGHQPVPDQNQQKAQPNQSINMLETALDLSKNRKVENDPNALGQFEPLNLSKTHTEENSTTPMQHESVSDVTDPSEGRLVINKTTITKRVVISFTLRFCTRYNRTITLEGICYNFFPHGIN